jgi:Mg2+/Co2+ transporter CorC
MLATCSISASATPAMSACRARTSSRSRRRPASPISSQLFADAGHSRLPVYRDELDTSSAWSISRTCSRSSPPARRIRTSIAGLIREPLYVPQSMGALDLLAQMRSSRTHLAIVLDEYSGTEGLITIEDLIEEIVGEIEDEHDEAPTACSSRSTAAAGTPMPAPSSRTSPRRSIRGWAKSMRISTRWAASPSCSPGMCPKPGECLAHDSGWTLEVIAADSRKVTRLRLHPPIKLAETED